MASSSFAALTSSSRIVNAGEASVQPSRPDRLSTATPPAGSTAGMSSMAALLSSLSNPPCSLASSEPLSPAKPGSPADSFAASCSKRARNRYCCGCCRPPRQASCTSFSAPCGAAPARVLRKAAGSGRNSVTRSSGSSCRLVALSVPRSCSGSVCTSCQRRLKSKPGRLTPSRVRSAKLRPSRSYTVPVATLPGAASAAAALRRPAAVPPVPPMTPPTASTTAAMPAAIPPTAVLLTPLPTALRWPAAALRLPAT